jgi:hypothetical protein
MAGRRIGCVGIVLLVCALGACSSGKSKSSSTTTIATTTTAVGGTTTSTPSTGATTTTPATPTTAGVPNCTFAQLRLTSVGDSATGHIGVILRFENTGTRTCKLTGYPGVAALNAAGKQAVQAKRTLNGFVGGVPDGQSPPVVTLATGQSASAFVEGTDVPTGNAACETYPRLLVTPPNTFQSVTVNQSMPGCSPIEVHPVVPGTQGSIGR